MNIKEVEELIRFVSKANVSEVELETKDIKIVIKTAKGGGEVQQLPVQVVTTAPVAVAPPVAAQPAKAAAPQTPVAEAPVANGNEAKYITVKSPMIGTFYRSPGPDKPAFVNVGDRLRKAK
jgi:acetyl-CoA carboxylase biotin carboxyl carrier protein